MGRRRGLYEFVSTIQRHVTLEGAKGRRSSYRGRLLVSIFDLSKVWFLQYDRRLVTANNIVPKGVILLQIRVVVLLIQRTALLTFFLLRRRDILNSLIPI